MRTGQVRMSTPVLAMIWAHIGNAYGREKWQLLGEEERGDIVARIVEGFRRSLPVTVLLSGLSQDNTRSKAQLEVEATEAVSDMVYALTPDQLRFALKILPPSSRASQGNS